MSRIGKRPVELPKGVTATVSGQTVEVKGPKGTRAFTATDDVTVAIDNETITVTPRGTSKRARQQWGMSRTQVANLVQGKVLKLALGYSHDVEYAIPEGIDIVCAKPTEIAITGTDQQQVGQVAANIRDWRRPEPYKGKGIRYKGEYIFRKEGKKK